MTQISIIVPVYNVLRYLDRCIESVLSQTFSDFELLLIDDGSTDSSGSRCDDWAEKDPRIRVFHTENRGQAAARNYGVQRAKSSLITFIDSDDSISPYYLEYHLRALRELNAECSIAAHRRITEADLPIEEQPLFQPVLWTQAQALHEMTARELRASEWNVLAPRIWYLENPLPEGMYYEDRAHIHRLFLQTSRVAFIDAELYYYLIRENSTLYSKTSTIKLCRDFQFAIQIAFHDLERSGLVTEKDIAVMVCRDCISLYLTAKRCLEAPEEAVEIGKWALEMLNRYHYKAIHNKSASKSVRLRIALMHTSPSLYRKLDWIIKRQKGWVC